MLLPAHLKLGQKRINVSRKYDLLLLVIVLLLFWQLLGWRLGPAVLPGPLLTLKQVGVEVTDAEFGLHLAETGKAFAVALFFALSCGIGLGVALGVSRLAGDVMEPVLITLYSIPKITLYPVILLMFGLGISAKIVFGIIHGIIPMTIFVMTAVRNIPAVHFRSIKALRLSAWQGMIRVLLPATVPEVVAGLRISFSLTLLGTLVGEMFASRRGIGHLLMHAIDQDDASSIMALALMLFMFASIVSFFLLKWDRYLQYRA